MTFLFYKHSYANSGFSFSPLLVTILGQKFFNPISVKQFLERFGLQLRVCLSTNFLLPICLSPNLLLPKADFIKYGFSIIYMKLRQR